MLLLIQGPGSCVDGDDATHSMFNKGPINYRIHHPGRWMLIVWGKFISRRVHMCVYSCILLTVLAEEVFFIGDHGPNVRNQDEQEARLHVTRNPHSSMQLKSFGSYRILLHLEIQCPLWPKAHNSNRLVKSNPLPTFAIQYFDKGSPSPWDFSPILYPKDKATVFPQSSTTVTHSWVDLGISAF